MKRAGKPCTVHTVLWHSENPRDAYAGPAGDGSFTQRFSRLADAQAFARGKLYYGQPAVVQTDTDVPRHLAQRWGVS